MNDNVVLKLILVGAKDLTKEELIEKLKDMVVSVDPETSREQCVDALLAVSEMKLMGDVEPDEPEEFEYDSSKDYVMDPANAIPRNTPAFPISELTGERMTMDEIYDGQQQQFPSIYPKRTWTFKKHSPLKDPTPEELEKLRRDWAEDFDDEPMCESDVKLCGEMRELEVGSKATDGSPKD